MSGKIAVGLGSVQKTLFLPLWGRAVESKKNNPLLVDKTALAIIEAVDCDFSSIARNVNELSQIAWIARSVCIDNVIRAFLNKYPGATVVNIGCGLDTTFDRIDNGTLLWYDLDLPDVIGLRKRFIKETDRRKSISASFLESNWSTDIRVNEQVLFIAAGVFYYFEENEVKAFLVRLADCFPGSEILCDVSSPFGVKIANQAVIKRTGLDESSFLKWGLDRTETMLAWDRRFRLLDTMYFFRSSGRSLSLKNRLLGYFSDLMRIQYMVHMKMRR